MLGHLLEHCSGTCSGNAIRIRIRIWIWIRKNIRAEREVLALSIKADGTNGRGQRGSEENVMAHVYQANVDRSRLLAKLVRELLGRASYGSVGELVDEIKRTCAKRRIPWTNDDIGEALRLIASNVPLPGRVERVLPRGPDEPAEPTKAEAAAMLQRLGIRVCEGRITR